MIGEMVKESRRAQAMSQEQLAAKAGISRTGLSNLETGKNLGIQAIAAVARALGLDFVLIDSRTGQSVKLTEAIEA
jgi:transcriptional regulator with XRE-family HTH domain